MPPFKRRAWQRCHGLSDTQHPITGIGTVRATGT
jgi:hypothetical protein